MYEHFPKHLFVSGGATFAPQDTQHTVWVVKSKGRRQKPTAPTAARFIGCGGRDAAAAPAVLGTHDVDFFFAVFLVRNNGVPTALLCSR